MTEQYTATVELDIRDDGTGEGDEAIIEALEAYSPAVGRSPLGNVEVVVTMPAATLTQAAQTVASVFEALLGAPIISIELMSVDDYSRRIGVESMPELISVTAAAEMLRVSRQAILARLESGSIAGEKVGNTWVVQKSSALPLLRLYNAESVEVHHFRGEPTETVFYEGTEYSQTGTGRFAGGSDRSISYAPTGSGIGLA